MNQEEERIIRSFIKVMSKLPDKRISQVENNKDIVQIIIFDRIFMLYECRIILNVLYTRSYVKDVWIQFISNRYIQRALVNASASRR